ncbi:unnamed protein product [Cutaneotrichosporon oleaginosum]
MWSNDHVWEQEQGGDQGEHRCLFCTPDSLMDLQHTFNLGDRTPTGVQCEAASRRRELSGAWSERSENTAGADRGGEEDSRRRLAAGDQKHARGATTDVDPAEAETACVRAPP